jgi:hypothetical protein
MLAVGIYRLVGVDAQPLPMDKGPRDWNNHRLLVPLQKSSSREPAQIHLQSDR